MDVVGVVFVCLVEGCCDFGYDCVEYCESGESVDVGGCVVLQERYDYCGECYFGCLYCVGNMVFCVLQLLDCCVVIDCGDFVEDDCEYYYVWLVLG